ncbi:MAG: ComEC/Rec2 family competence protein [Bacteroidales bacterium]|nr:ComEC/Rec2 family competence protein [Bacteroidales bacterium]
MWKGRTLFFCSLAFIAGDLFGGWLTLPPLLFLILAIISAVSAHIYRKRLLILTTLLLLGASSLQISRIPAYSERSAIALTASYLKESFSRSVSEIISEGEELAIVRALTIGDKGDINRELRENYRKSGAMHLLALSGLHVGIIYKIVELMLFFIGGSITARRIKSLFIVILLWCFAIVTGLSSSIFRAVLMITIYEFSGWRYSDRDGLTSLAAGALIITIFNPEAPREVGFQLSFCAVLSIFTIYPLIKRLMYTRIRLLERLWNGICISISCQMTTGVIAYFYFGSFPLYFLLTNIMAIPLTAVTLYMTATALITKNIPFVGTFSATILQFTVGLLNKIVEIIANL